MKLGKLRNRLQQVLAISMATAITLTSCPVSVLGAEIADTDEVVASEQSIEENSSIEEITASSEEDVTATEDTGEEVDLKEDCSSDETELLGSGTKLYQNDMSSVSAASLCKDGVLDYGITTTVSAISISENLGEDSGNKAVEYTTAFNSKSSWEEVLNWKNANFYPDSLSISNMEKVTIGFDIYLPSDAEFEGTMKTIGVVKNQDWQWMQGEIGDVTQSDFSLDEETGLLKASVAMDVKEYEDKGTTYKISEATQITAILPCIAGANCDYSGPLYIDNLKLTGTEQSDKIVTPVKTWETKNDFSGFAYSSGWNWDYPASGVTTISGDVTSAQAVDAFDGSLKIHADYSRCGELTWSQLAVASEISPAVNMDESNTVTFDFYYEDAKKTNGSFKTKICLQDTAGEIANAEGTIDFENAESAGNGIMKAEATAEMSAIDADDINKIVVNIIGYQTTYQGDLWIDNLEVSKTESKEDIYVDRTVSPLNGNSTLTVKNGSLYNVSGNKIADLLVSANMVDQNANTAAKKTYAYLKAIGESDSVLFGHENDTFDKAGSKSLNEYCSDTYDVTNDFAGIFGIDALSLTGSEYSGHGDTPAEQVSAAAAITNQSIQNGAIVTMSAHMPNFSKVEARETTDTEHSYAKYNFTGYSPDNLTGNVMKKILPDGEYNEVYNAYLDMIADYADQVDGAILFRPFHENTGSWFWWGAALCDAQTYKSVYKYTVEYLRDEKNVHNMIYVYGPGSEAANEEEYASRYPGDDYVDMVGFDMYHKSPTAGDTWFDSLKTEIEVVNAFATHHNKLFAVTETGVSNETQDGDSQTALLKSGNAQKDWYTSLLNAVSESDASYFMVWSNFAKNNGFYTPYVESVNDGVPHGHEMMDEFVNYYNDDRSIFASDQKNALSAEYPEMSVSPVQNDTTGYITAPIAGSRVLKATTLKAKLTNVPASTDVTFRVTGEDAVILKLNASCVSGSNLYSAKLTTEQLDYLGTGKGTIEIYSGSKMVDSLSVIFNEEEAKEDPYLIDDFEGYYGQDSQMTAKWSSNKASGTTVKFYLTNDTTKTDGGYGMAFQYDEKADQNDAGWGGAVINKNVDWSDCNAVSFYTVPDGNNQKVVFQITANTHVYEAYLNSYPEYRDSTTPMKITIPFKDFVDRDKRGVNLTDELESIESIGVWVNSIANTAAVSDGRVKGTIYYDNITAVKTDATEPVLDESSTETVSVKSVTYTGSKLTPALTVKVDGVILKAGEDYTAKYSNNLNAGTGTVVVSGKKNYQFSASANFIIHKKSLPADDIEVALPEYYEYTGKVQKVAPKVTFGTKTLKDGKEISCQIYKDGSPVTQVKEEGSYVCKISAKSDNFEGMREVSFTVTKKVSLEKHAKIKLSVKTTDYDGTPKQLSENQIQVKYGKNVLKQDTDYTVSYENNQDAGTALVLITAKEGSDYTGTAKATFTIKGVDLKSGKASGIEKSYSYTGKEIKPADNQAFAFTIQDQTLVKGSDYTVSYQNNKNAGNAVLQITGKGKYSGTKVVKFKILPVELSQNMVGTNEVFAVYSATGSTPDLTVSSNGTILQKGVDYTCKYKKNKSVTTSSNMAEISIKGMGNYKGNLKAAKKFTITAKSLADTGITAEAEDMELVQNASKDYVTKLNVYDNGKKLKAGKDYKITSVSGNDKSITDPTTAEITISGVENSNYGETKIVTYRIAKTLLNKAKVSIQPQKYTGTAVTLSKDQITITYNGETVAASEYKISKITNNNGIGMATVTLNGKGDFAGSKTVKFLILPKIF